MIESRALLLDGSALLYRAVYASLGKNGTMKHSPGWMFGRNVLSILNSVPSSHWLLCFDDRSTRRKHLLPSYKANRVDKLNPWVQFSEDCNEALRFLSHISLPVVKVNGQEADDVIATYADRFVQSNVPVVIASRDKDFFQLVDDNKQVTLFDLNSKVFATAESCIARYGVTPAQFTDFQALVGDSADNIPGVSGIGPKRAAALLEKWGTLDRIIQNADEVQPKRFREVIRNDADLIKTYKQVVTLNGTAYCPLGLEDLLRSPLNDTSAKYFLRQVRLQWLARQEHEQQAAIAGVEDLELAVPDSSQDASEGGS